MFESRRGHQHLAQVGCCGLMSNTFSPKLLTSRTANELADLRLIQEDLRHVQDCCSQLLNEQHCMLTSTKGKALLDSLAVRYRRCFNSGVRTPLKLGSLDITTDEQTLHDFFYAIVDKHIAHSVNNFELNGTTVYIAIKSDGNIVRSALGANGAKTVNLSLHDVKRFKSYVISLLQKIELLNKKYSEIVSSEVAAMTDEELKKLPDGFAILDRDLDVKETRK